MCRYAYKVYKTHYACFNCRKTFKQPPAEDLARNSADWEDYQRAFLKGDFNKFQKEHPEKVEYLKKTYRNRQFKCPDCGKIMANMGLDFKAPKKEKVKEWGIIKNIYHLGHSFLSCGCDGPGFIPKDKTEYRNYLEKRRDEYQKRLNVKHSNIKGNDLPDYLAYWRNIIERIDIEMKKLKI